MVKRILIASNNPGKTAEIRALLAGLDLKILSPREIGIDLDVQETGQTYQENARLKALAFLDASGLASLADDTGLEVDSLSGAPGLHSKRYAPDPQASDSDRRRLLLANLAGKPRPWKARFVCAVALAAPDGQIFIQQGMCGGRIIPQERGEDGFGYDRIFLFPELGKTMAELDIQEKNLVSHRARAVKSIIPRLKAL